MRSRFFVCFKMDTTANALPPSNPSNKTFSSRSPRQIASSVSPFRFHPSRTRCGITSNMTMRFRSPSSAFSLASRNHATAATPSNAGSNALSASCTSLVRVPPPPALVVVCSLYACATSGVSLDLDVSPSPRPRAPSSSASVSVRVALQSPSPHSNSRSIPTCANSAPKSRRITFRQSPPVVRSVNPTSRTPSARASSRT
mmetsp:Transcript_7507/g.30156  ORF Transcript_7507/g.30156 Transcript_7507/m.30156 type:complete len:200 (-) Transcript_7507:203-802(-)